RDGANGSTSCSRCRNTAVSTTKPVAGATMLISRTIIRSRSSCQCICSPCRPADKVLPAPFLRPATGQGPASESRLHPGVHRALIPATSLPAMPEGRCQRTKRCGRYRAVDPQPQTAHGEYRHSNGLEDRPLLILWPTTKAAPDGRENAGKTGEAAKNAVQKAHACIRGGAPSFDGLHRRSGEAISAVEHEHHADRDADVVRTGPSENCHPQRDSKAGSQQEWPQPAPAQRVPQFPDRDALHHQPEGDDQGCGLYRREDVQPNGGGNQSECKPCHPRDQRGSKGRRQINGNVDDRSIHRSLIPVISARMPALRIDSVASAF